MAKLIDGKYVSQNIRAEIAESVSKLAENGIFVGLAVVLVGNDPASAVYVRNKKKACEAVGIQSFQYELPEETTEAELIKLIEKLNNDDRVDGILVQLPLPKHISEKSVISAIRPDKDVDGFCNENVGKLLTGEEGMVSCTPKGVIELLKFYGIEISGKSCAVLGRSNIVGKPMAVLMLRENATVTVCHSKTEPEYLKEVCRNADIIICAVGKPKYLTADMVKDGAVVIDVGINRKEDGKLCGDVDFEQVQTKASYISPVPGGVGPMTITMLLKNTVYAAKHRRDK